MGRPKLEFDLAVVELCGRLACTYQETASTFGCSESTVERRMADEESEFCRSYKKGLAEATMSLRRKQIELAMDGNVTMLVWLGKQLLGQSDKASHRLKREPDFEPSITVVLHKDSESQGGG